MGPGFQSSSMLTGRRYDVPKGEFEERQDDDE